MGQRLRAANLGSQGVNSERVKGVDFKVKDVFEGKVKVTERTRVRRQDIRNMNSLCVLDKGMENNILLFVLNNDLFIVHTAPNTINITFIY